MGGEKIRKVLTDKIRLMEVEVDMHKRQREFEQGQDDSTPHSHTPAPPLA